MAGNLLMNSDIEAGAALVRELDARGMAPETAAWLYYDDREEWRLLLQFDEAHQKHPTLVRIAEIINTRDDIAQGLTIGDLTVVGPQDDIVVALRSLVKTGDGVGFMRFGPASANGVYFEQGLVYRALDFSVVVPRHTETASFE